MEDRSLKCWGYQQQLFCSKSGTSNINQENLFFSKHRNK